VKGFRQFLMQGNLIELAIAVVIGTAFTAIVTAIVKDLITPLIAAIGGKPNFGRLQFTVHNSTFAYGDFVNALVSFLIIAAVVYYLIVAPVGRLTTRLTRNRAATERDCPECLSAIPVAATRCKYCTAVVTPAIAPTAGPERGFGPSSHRKS
jgi:large conductance mechanosensitive channel